MYMNCGSTHPPQESCFMKNISKQECSTLLGTLETISTESEVHSFLRFQ